MDQDTLKKQVGEAAAKHIAPHLTPDSVVGVGTGSTANCFIDSLAHYKHDFMSAVASSDATASRLEAHGIRVDSLNDIKDMAFYVDGADEIDHALAMTKGGGGALTREKIVASVAQTFICIADESKLVDRLGGYPIPIEVIPMARSCVARQIVNLGGRPTYRHGFETDNGNVILDVHDLKISDPIQLEKELNNIPGVVTNGLFAMRGANLLLMATNSGIKQITAK